MNAHLSDRLIWSLFAVALSTSVLADADPPAEKPWPVLKGVWFAWEPYEYLNPETPLAGPTGLDIELTSTILSRLGYDIEFHQQPDRARHLEDIRSGAADFSTSPRTDEREQFANFSDPIRQEINVLYVRRGESGKYAFRGIDQMLEMLSRRRFRLGLLRGFDYGPESLRQYIRANEDSRFILHAPDATTLFRALKQGSIDGFIMDRLVGATTAWKTRSHRDFETIPLPAECSYDICLMFSKRTTPSQLVESINQSIQVLKREGGYDAIVRKYALPMLLAITVGRGWFFSVDILGTIAFAISGVILARKEKYNLIGAFVLAALPAVGGGMLRDLIVNRVPLGVLRTPAYLLAVIIVVLGAYFAFKLLAPRHEHLVVDSLGDAAGRQQRPAGVTLANWAFQICDTVGLAAFTVIGVVVAAESGAAPLVLWGPLLAALTSSGGGVLRDIVRADPHTSILKTGFYPEVSLIWGLLFAVFLDWQTDRLNPNEVFLGVVVTFAGAFFTRLGVIHFRVKPLSF